MPEITHTNRDNRRFERVEAGLPVRYRFSDRLGALWQEAKTSNVSEGGLFIETDLSPDKLGNIVHADILVQERRVHFICQLVWVKRDVSKAQGLGLKIIQAGNTERQAYLTYIYSRVSAPVKRRFLRFLRQPLSRLPERERRCYQILDLLRRFGPISKADIAKALNLNAMSTSKFVDQFQRQDLVFEYGLDISTGGRRAQLFRLNESFGLIAGIEVNMKEKYSSFAIVDFAFRAVYKDILPLSVGESMDKVLSEVIDEIKAKIQNEFSRFIAFGVAVNKKDEYPGLEQKLSQSLELPVVVEESFHLEPFAEMWTNRDFADKSILHIYSENIISLVLANEIYKPIKEIEGRAELVSLGLETKALTLIELLSPEIVTVSKRVNDLKPEVIDSIRKKLLSIDGGIRPVKIMPASLPSQEAAAFGAAALAAREVYVGICRE